jgi:hypothetical protein
MSSSAHARIDLWKLLILQSDQQQNKNFSLEHNAVYSTDSAATCFHPSVFLHLSNLKMEAICSSETSVDFQHTALFYTPEDSILHKQHIQNFKPYIFVIDPVFILLWKLFCLDDKLCTAKVSDEFALNKENSISQSSKDININWQINQVEEDEMGVSCSTYEREEERV